MATGNLFGAAPAHRSLDAQVSLHFVREARSVRMTLGDALDTCRRKSARELQAMEIWPHETFSMPDGELAVLLDDHDIASLLTIEEAPRRQR
jgi:hypothetical protein